MGGFICIALIRNTPLPLSRGDLSHFTLLSQSIRATSRVNEYQKLDKFMRKLLFLILLVTFISVNLSAQLIVTVNVPTAAGLSAAIKTTGGDTAITMT
jgi:hypothetical protein